MSRLGKITRRTFLVASAAVAGGVAFGVWKAREVPPNPLHPTHGTALNPWLVIDDQGTTIVVPRAEMGQGVSTTLAALVAEELDVAFEGIRAIHGPPAQAYFNGALMEGSLPYPDYTLTPRQRWIGEQLAVLPKIFSLQVTGGSTSTVDAFEKMRLAGATARETLKRAAAARLGVSAGSLSTENGKVLAPDGTAIPYAELAAEAAAIEPPRVALRDPSEWKLLGRPLPRTDMVAKVTGTAGFGADVMLPGMKFATVRMNPRLGGPMLSFDPAPALAIPGVERVVDLGTGIAVVARSTWHALRGVEAVAIEWGPAPYPESSEAIFETIAAAFEAEPNSTLRDDGEIPAPAEGDVTAEYRVPFLAHATMEPMNATAHRTEAGLEVWCGNQAPVATRDKCAEALGLLPEQVMVHTLFLGGGFGRRAEVDFSVLAARVADAVAGTPVKVSWSREEDVRHDFYRPAAIARFRGRLDGGRIGALEARIAGPSVTRQAMQRLAGFSSRGADKGHVEGAYDQPYAIPNWRVAGHLADLAVPVGFWRSVGNSFNGFFHESFIDELAHAAGADPLRFRIDHVRPAHAPSAALLEAGGEMSGWRAPAAPGTAKGVALTYSFGTPVAEVVEVRDEGGRLRISRAWIACDPGRALDPAIVEAQMVSGLIFGLSAAVMCEISFTGGEVDQRNFPDYDALRLHNAPAVEVRILENKAHISGVGEPGTPPAAAALANAVFALTGRRIRELPLGKTVDFLL
jgi:isoquinoline 1-oxidoreductase beta subunit